MYSNQVKNYYKQYIQESIEPNDLIIFNHILNIFLNRENFIDLNILAEYLNVFKRNLKARVIDNYIEGVDYIIKSAPNNKNNEKYIYLTIDCAKHICLRSSTVQGKMIRNYFIFAENMYQEYMLENIQYKLDETDDDLLGGAPQTNFKIGECVYVISIKKGDVYIYKIGKTKNLNTRYKQHFYSIPGLQGVVYYELFEHNRFLEVCIQDFLSQRQLSIQDMNNKNLIEIYATELSDILSLFEICKQFRENTKFSSNPASVEKVSVIYE